MRFQHIKSLWFRNLRHLLKPHSTIKSAVGIVYDGAVSNLIDASKSFVVSVQHTTSNSKQIRSRYLDISRSQYLKSHVIYLSSLGKYSSSVTVNCFPTFWSLSISLLTSLLTLIHFYSSLLRKILEMLHFLQYAKIYQIMENVGGDLSSGNLSVRNLNKYQIINP